MVVGSGGRCKPVRVHGACLAVDVRAGGDKLLQIGGGELAEVGAVVVDRRSISAPGQCLGRVVALGVQAQVADELVPERLSLQASGQKCQSY